MLSQRQVKYTKQLKVDLNAIFIEKKYFNVSLVTITDVEISMDLRVAKIFLSIYPSEKSLEIFQQVQSIKSNIRYELGKKIKNSVRLIPELVFIKDTTLEKASRIESILNNLKIPPKSSESQSE